VNERKLCLASELFGSQPEVKVFESGYFDTFLTNEMFGLELVALGPRPSVEMTGVALSGWLRPDGGLEIPSIGDDMMFNGIGVGTLAHSEDGFFCLWVQNPRALHAVDELVPTGSGSCDAKDARGHSSLKSILISGMNRELVEESSAAGVGLRREDIRETRVLGYYRALDRGGKPEFIGVTKLRVASGRLEPNVEEVEAPEWVVLKWPARSYSEMLKQIEARRAEERLSLPLRMCLVALDEAMREPGGRGLWTSFFGISSG
jgi:hypothetical protein